MIEANDLTKAFGSHTQVLRGVSLSVPDGAFTVILGAAAPSRTTASILPLLPSRSWYSSRRMS